MAKVYKLERKNVVLSTLGISFEWKDDHYKLDAPFGIRFRESYDSPIRPFKVEDCKDFIAPLPSPFDYFVIRESYFEKDWRENVPILFREAKKFENLPTGVFVHPDYGQAIPEMVVFIDTNQARNWVTVFIRVPKKWTKPIIFSFGTLSWFLINENKEMKRLSSEEITKLGLDDNKSWVF